MKSCLEKTDAWLEALGPSWKRLCFFCVLLVGSSNLGDYFWDEDNQLKSYFWTGGMFGPLTYVFFGPLQAISMITTGWVAFRFFHLQRGETIGLVFLALVVAINTGFYGEKGMNIAKIVQLHLVAMVVLAVLLRLRYKSHS